MYLIHSNIAYKVASVYFDGWRKYKRFTMHPNFIRLGYFWTGFYLLRPVAFLYLTYRIGVSTAKVCVDQWNGKGHYVYTVVQDEWYYDTWFKDSRDQRHVNFRYSDHTDTKEGMSAWNHDIFKPEADYYKGLYKYLKKGTDSYFEYFTHWDKK
jgi:hypothetical protein